MPDPSYKPYIFKNPYDRRDVGTDGHKLSARVPISEWRVAKELFPILPGISDKLLSNLTKLFIDFLKNQTKTHGPIESAWTVDHPTYTLITEFFRRCEFGLSAGCSCSRDEPATTCRLCEAMQCSSKQCPDAQGSPDSRGSSPGCGEEGDQESSKEGQRGGSISSPRANNERRVMTVEEQLRMLGCGD